MLNTNTNTYSNTYPNTWYKTKKKFTTCIRNDLNFLLHINKEKLANKNKKKLYTYKYEFDTQKKRIWFVYLQIFRRARLFIEKV
jgi:hypothetical protein